MTRAAGATIFQQYVDVRNRTVSLCAPLLTEDYVIQPMADASPPKWHLAHVTWFFETFLLKAHFPGYTPFNVAFEVLFNSYYNGVGKQFPRAKRGHLSRPTVSDVYAYRDYVDDKMKTLLEREMSEDVLFKVILGLNHEQQHQELLLTDIKFNFGNNPLFPVYQETAGPQGRAPDLEYVEIKGGIYEVGAATPTAEKFAFDNESPPHDVLVRDFRISNRLVTNREYLQFIQEEGYSRPELWLSDAWSLINTESNGPLYWHKIENDWFEFTLAGLSKLDLEKPVCHITGYEADAYARWQGARLPSEQEWEVMASSVAVEGNFVESARFHPQVAHQGESKLMQVFGDLWEWTSSSYGPYPGFREFPGALGEYNGKFMANQLVLRGGSCVTSHNHIRTSYRNFFYPKDQWQFSGIRLVLNS